MRNLIFFYFEKGKYISYANCGLPYYIGGVIAEREKLLVQTPTSFGQRFRVDVRVENEVIAIHPKDKTITVRTADGREYEETYDKLLLSSRVLHLFDHHWKVSILKEFSLSVMLKIPII